MKFLIRRNIDDPHPSRRNGESLMRTKQRVSRARLRFALQPCSGAGGDCVSSASASEGMLHIGCDDAYADCAPTHRPAALSATSTGSCRRGTEGSATADNEEVAFGSPLLPRAPDAGIAKGQVLSSSVGSALPKHACWHARAQRPKAAT